MNLDDLMKLAAALPALPDDRPAWLRAMPYVTQPGSSYYQFLWELVKRYRPAKILEIGIDKAGSTLSLAAANTEGSVTSMDISAGVCENARAIARHNGVQNLTILEGDSLKSAGLVQRPFDLMFLDSWHSFDQVYREWENYRPLMRPGGIILFDDIRYSKEMEVAWGYINDPKIDLSMLHHSGFGACQVDPAVTPRFWEAIKDEAKERYSR
jgi:predicted O-methyltransferase YrrM